MVRPCVHAPVGLGLSWVARWVALGGGSARGWECQGSCWGPTPDLMHASLSGLD